MTNTQGNVGGDHNGRKMLWEDKRNIHPNRGQTFFQAESINVIYDITVTGTISYSWKKGYHDKKTVRGSADALYKTTDIYEGDTGKYESKHDWLRINGQSIKSDQLFDKNGKQDRFGLKADRDNHIYRLRLTDIRDRLVVSCEAEEGDSFTLSGLFNYFTVSATAYVKELPKIQRAVVPNFDTSKLTCLAVDEAGTLIPPITSGSASDVQKEVFALYVEAEALRGWEDEGFQRRYAGAHTEELLSQATDIRSLYRKMLSSGNGHTKAAALQYLELNYPMVMKRLRGRLNAVAIAEELSCAADRPKPTTDEWRERQARHIQTVAKDEALKLATKVEAELAIHDWLDQKERTIRDAKNLNDDEKNRRIVAIRAVAKSHLSQEGANDASQEPQPEIL